VTTAASPVRPPAISDRSLAEMLIQRLRSACAVELFVREIASDVHFVSVVGRLPGGAVVEGEAISATPVDALCLALSNLDEAITPEGT